MKKSFLLLLFPLILIKIDAQKPELILPVGHILSDTSKISLPAFLSNENLVFYVSGNSGRMWNRSENTSRQLFNKSEYIFSCKFIDSETKILVGGLRQFC
jgi:hypothetical protein